MAVGLTKDSPIQLSLSRENYEAMIERHGQTVRIINSNKCNCILDSGHPDPNCSTCGGDGIYYTFQRIKKIHKKMCKWRAINGVIQTPAGEKDKITKVYVNGIVLSPNSYRVEGNYIISDKIKPYDFVEIDFDCETYRDFEGILTPIEEKVVALIDKTNNSKEIVECIEVKNKTTDKKIGIERFDRNLIFLKDSVKKNDVILGKLKYVLPQKVLIHSQMGSKKIQNFLTANSLDSAMTFPFELDITREDVVTLLNASRIEQVVIPKGCPIPEFFVSDIISIRDKEKEYLKNVDFVLRGRNEIYWLKKENEPLDGKNLSVKYRYNPSYRVTGDFQHELRSAEDQILPRMVGLKLIVGGGSPLEGINETKPVAPNNKATVDDIANFYFGGE